MLRLAARAARQLRATSTMDQLRHALLRATSLEERVAWNETDTDAPHGFHARQWLAQPHFHDMKALARRAGALGMTSESFLSHISRTVTHGGECVPAWTESVMRALEQYNNSSDYGGVATEDGLLVAARPFLSDALERARQRHAAISWPRSFSVAEGGYGPLIIRDLVARIAPRVLQALVLELNVYRLRNQLVGDTPEARYTSFLVQMQDGSRLVSLFTEYPVLAREMVTSADHWVEHISEILEHLASDYVDIGVLLAWPSDVRALSAISLGAGDSHRRGPGVAVLEFSDGRRL